MDPMSKSLYGTSCSQACAPTRRCSDVIVELLQVGDEPTMSSREDPRAGYTWLGLTVDPFRAPPLAHDSGVSLAAYQAQCDVVSVRRQCSSHSKSVYITEFDGAGARLRHSRAGSIN